MTHASFPWRCQTCLPNLVVLLDLASGLSNIDDSYANNYLDNCLDNSIHDLLLNILVAHSQPLKSTLNQIIITCFQNNMLVLTAQTLNRTLVLRIGTTLFFKTWKRSVWIITCQIWFLNVFEVVDCKMSVVLKDLFER